MQALGALIIHAYARGLLRRTDVRGRDSLCVSIHAGSKPGKVCKFALLNEIRLPASRVLEEKAI
jgi:hypothetical protein